MRIAVVSAVIDSKYTIGCGVHLMSLPPTNKAANTGALWNAVGGQPLAEVLSQMESDGWARESVNDGDVTQIILVREKKRATLFVVDQKVGMVSVQEQSRTS